MSMISFQSAWLYKDLPSIGESKNSYNDTWPSFAAFGIVHYENMPIQIYWKFNHQKMKIFR